MSFVYNITIYLYMLGIRVATLFSGKAKLWVNGRKELFPRMEAALSGSVGREGWKVVWFHCASLGEFEQGRPVIEAFRMSFPGYKVLLTFFSPSGYEIRKNYQEADYVFYLPLDTPGNAERFVSLVQPDLVFFIKYEFWFNHLKVLREKRVPVYFISAIFRPGQHFFQWYGGWFRKQLAGITWFFLQDAESAALLTGAGIQQCSVAGDTRFDRVDAIVNHLQEFPLVERFKGNTRIVIGGSTWPTDEQFLLSRMKEKGANTKFIIAPHETNKERIDALMDRIPLPAIRYSELNGENAVEIDVLVIDCIGILAHLYQYATIAFIGGGFGAGIHNTLEAATFGVPVIFGPNYHSFREARELVSLGGAFSVENQEQCDRVFNQLLLDTGAYAKSSSACKKYVQENRGVTDKILIKIHG
jgi:3-deoxy-D-manno-octulosonic-acid transferase